MRGVLILLCLLGILIRPVLATDTPFGKVEDYLPKEVTDLLPADTVTQVKEGKEGAERLLEKVLAAFSQAVPQCLSDASVLLGMVLLFSALRLMPWKEKRMVTAVGTVCLTLTGMRIVTTLWQSTVQTVSALHQTVTAMLPSMSALMLLGGNTEAAVVQSGTLGIALWGLESILADGFVPFLSILLALTVLSAFGGNEQIRFLFAKLRQFFLWALGLFFGVLLLTLGYQGTIAAAKDTLTARTLKLALGNSVPIVGGALGDSVRTLLSGLALLKSTVGGIGILAICYLCLPPLGMLFAYRIVFSALELLCGWLDGKEYAQFFSQIGELLRFSIALLLGSSLFFLLTFALFSKSIAAYS